MPEDIDLSLIDLVATSCPPGATIEIEGKGSFGVDLPGMNLVGGIAHVLTILTGRPTTADDDFLGKITVTALDVPKKFIKVRISD